MSTNDNTLNETSNQGSPYRTPHTTLRIKALRLFKREYFLNPATLVDSEAAADSAMQKVRDVFVTGKGLEGGLLKTHPTVKDLTTEQRHNLWGDILEVLIEWQLLLINVPLDKARISIKPSKDITYNPDRQ